MGTRGVGKQGYQYPVVIVDDLRNFVRVEEAATYMAEVAARAVLRWCSVIGVPHVWVRDMAKYLKNRVLRLVAEQLGTNHRFSVVNTAWTNVTVERMMLEVVKTFRVVASAARTPVKGWVWIVPIGQGR